MNAVLAWVQRPAVIRTGRMVAYVAFGFLAFFVSVVLTFPTGRLGTFLESRLSGGGRVVRIDNVSLTGLSSLRLEGLRVQFPPEGAPAQNGTPLAPERRQLVVDRLDVSVGLFRLLFGTLSVTATARNGEGVLGPVKLVKSGDTITVSIKEIKDFPLPADLPLLGLRFTGSLSGRGNVVYSLKEGLAGSSGRLELEGTKLKVIKPTLKSEQQGSVTLTDVDLGKLRLVLNLDKRSALAVFKAERRAPGGDATLLQFEKGEIDGSDVKVLVEEHSVLRPLSGKGILESQLNVELAFSLSDAFFERSVNVGGEAQTPNRFLRTLLSLDPRWKTAQSGGYWGVVCTGTLGHPSCLPKRPAIRGGDFKAPTKEGDNNEAKPSGPARVSPAAPPPPAPSAPPQPASQPSAPPPAPPPRAAPQPVPAPEPVEQAGPPPAAPSSSVIEGVRPVVPTVIGRPRPLIRTIEPVGGEAASGEGGGTVAPSGGSNEGQE